MVTYLFYPHQPDGSASMFMAYDLGDDAEAMACAGTVLAEHASAVEVAVWRDDRIVGRVGKHRGRQQRRPTRRPEVRYDHAVKPIEDDR